LLITTEFTKNLCTKKRQVLCTDINEILPVFATFIIPFVNIMKRKHPQKFTEEMFHDNGHSESHILLSATKMNLHLYFLYSFLTYNSTYRTWT
jgi:hypothetical protein